MNATPDVARQVESHEVLHPGPGARESPVAGVVMTDAEFDHAIGLLLLREGASLDVYATGPVLRLLEDEFPVRRLVERYSSFRWHEVGVDQTFTLSGGLVVTLFPVADKPPKYSGRTGPLPGAVVGCRMEDTATNGRLIWAPQIGRWDQRLADELDAASCVLVDGTFWAEDDMATAGVGSRPASAMGHLPLCGDEGLAAKLAKATAGRKLLVHINNTNPIHDPASEQRHALESLGVEVAYAGLTMEL